MEGAVMANNERFESDQLVLTPELLAFMHRIMSEHEREFRNLASKILAKKPIDPTIIPPQAAQEVIVGFFSMMDDILEETYQTNEIAAHTQRQLLPSLEHIDCTNLDPQAVMTSVQRATDVAQNMPNVDAQEVLYQELLNRWKPSKKTATH